MYISFYSGTLGYIEFPLPNGNYGNRTDTFWSSPRYHLRSHFDKIWLTVPGYGFMLNNGLTDFNGTPALNLDPGNFNPGANDVAACDPEAA